MDETTNETAGLLVPIDEGDAVLRDGSTVHLRSLTAADRELYVAFFDSLSMETRRRRFFRALAHMDGPLLDHLLDVDNDHSIAIVALREGRIIGIGRADRTTGTESLGTEGPEATVPTAEVAFTVGDGLHGLGIATILLEALAARARLLGIRRFVALTQADNREMLGVFRSAGFAVKLRRDPDDASIVVVAFLIEDDGHARAARRDRERTAVSASLRPLLEPESIAVIGASSTKDSPGRRVVRELLANGFVGLVFPVNPKAEYVEGLPAVPTVADIPVPVDLAVVAVPAGAVVAVAEECAAAGVRGLLVISSGFAETGPEGRARQAALVAVCRGSGMRLIGPNCLGVITTAEEVRMHAVFTRLEVRRGGLALMSQSGAVAIAIASLAAQQGIGMSSLVSVGNKADVSGNDLLEYWDQDAATRVIAVYLESFGNPRRFARIARDVSRRKPIVAIKAARSQAGSRAAASHTAALAAPDTIVDALFEQTGVLRVEDPRELLALASALDRLALPAGRRVAIVGNAGGLGILTADAMASEALSLATFEPATVEDLRRLAPPNSALSNPVDLTATASPDQLRGALNIVLADVGVDAVVALHVSVRPDDQAHVLETIADVVQSAQKPVLLMFGTAAGETLTGADRVGEVALAATPREVALVLGRMADRAEWLERQREPERPIDPTVIEGIRGLVADGLVANSDGGWLSATVAFGILGAAGIPVAPPVEAADADAAADAAGAIGFPVCLKAANPALMHRSDVGAVHVGIRDEYGVVCAFQSIQHALAGDMHGAFVQPMAEPGVEMILGITNDSQFGSFVVVGSGGRTAELWRDTAIHVAPLDRDAAAAMVRSLRSRRLLNGFRGAPPADEAALVDALVRIAQLAADVPEIAELDANPIIVHPHGVTAVDVKIRVAPNHVAGRDEIRVLR